jgi:imidazolonepropionase-like amidohydrolase
LIMTYAALRILFPRILFPRYLSPRFWCPYIVLAGGSLCIAGAAAATSVTTEAAPTSYVHAGRLVDVEHGAVLTDQLITIVGGRVTRVAPWAGKPSDGPVVDWSHYTVLPGLIDAHTHIADWLQTNNDAEPLLHSPQDVALVGALHARQTLRAGFTTVHDVGVYQAFTDVSLRNAINKGWVEGPRMNVVGAYITIKGGGGDIDGGPAGLKVPDNMHVGIVSNPENTRQKVDYLFAHGVDSIKLIATGAVLAEGTEPGQMELTEDEMRAASQEAAKHGSFTVAHAHGAEGIKAAIRAGVRSIEHASLIDDEGIAMAKAHGTFLDMDIYDGDYIDQEGRRQGWSASILRKNTETTEAQREGFRKAVKAGVKMSFGTDAGVYPHGTNAKQFAYMVRYGMTPMQAIQAATINAAILLQWQKDVGSLSPGHYADMIAVDGDATQNVAVLEHVSAVMKGGELIR